MRTKSRRALVAVLFMAGCTGEPLGGGPDPDPFAAAANVQASIGSPFRLAPGQFAAVEDRDLLVALRAVQGDSRCPRDVSCVWQGDAEVVIGVAAEGSDWSWSVLHTGMEPRWTLVDGLVVTLVDVEPQPLAAAAIPAEDYRVVLSVNQE